MPRPQRLHAVLLGCALVITPGVLAATPASASTTSVALVGDLQDELGCTDDWQPECAATELVKVAGSTEYRATFDMPRGEWNVKVALNDSWDVNYGSGGAAGGGNLALAVPAGGGRYTFTWDQVTHIPSVEKVG